MCVFCVCVQHIRRTIQRFGVKNFGIKEIFCLSFRKAKKKKKCRGIKGKQSKRGSKIKEDQEAMLDQIKEKRP